MRYVLITRDSNFKEITRDSFDSYAAASMSRQLCQQINWASGMSWSFEIAILKNYLPPVFEYRKAKEKSTIKTQRVIDEFKPIYDNLDEQWAFADEMYIN